MSDLNVTVNVCEIDPVTAVDTVHLQVGNSLHNGTEELNQNNILLESLALFLRTMSIQRGNDIG